MNDYEALLLWLGLATLYVLGYLVGYWRGTRKALEEGRRLVDTVLNEIKAPRDGGS